MTFRPRRMLSPLVLLAFSCDSESADPPDAKTDAPQVLSTIPADAATGVATNVPITATFRRAVDPATVDVTTFLVNGGDVAGAVSFAGTTATFTPTAALEADAEVTATLTTGITDAAGLTLAQDFTWSFRTLADDAPPAVTTTSPAHGATDVGIAEPISASFNRTMDPATLDATTFTLVQGATAVVGAVTYAAATNTATFTPTGPMLLDRPYTATITVGAMSASGLPLATARTWSFTTIAALPAALPVDLGAASAFVILAKTGISSVPPSVLTGDLGLSPAARTYVEGFSLTADATNVFSTSSQVTGKVFAADDAPPTPDTLTTSVSAMQTAFTDAAGRAADVTELGAGNIGGMTLGPGVYAWSSSLYVPTDVTLTGAPTDVWIFQISGDLLVSSATNVLLAGGALPKNVFWQVAGIASLDTTAHLEGIVLSQTAITLNTGASVNGRLLAQSAVTLDASTVVAPAP